MTEMRPAEVFAPGDYITDEMHARGWTELQLCEALGVPLDDLKKLLTAERRLLMRDAANLERAWGISFMMWLNLERYYRKWTAQGVPRG